VNPCCNGLPGFHVGLSGYTPGFFADNPVQNTFNDVRDGLSNSVILGETLPFESGHNGICCNSPMTVVLSTPLNVFATPEEIVPASGPRGSPMLPRGGRSRLETTPRRQAG